MTVIVHTLLLVYI